MPFLFSRFKSRSSPSPPPQDCIQQHLRRPDEHSIRSDQHRTMGHRQSRVRGGATASQPTTCKSTQPHRQKDNTVIMISNDDPWSPPPYTPTALKSATDPPSSTSSTSNTSNTSNTSDTPYDFLREFDTIFVVDDSSSMLGRRWKEAEQAIAAIAPICTQYDHDGIDIYFLNHRREPTAADPTPSLTGAYNNITEAAHVQEIFSSVRPRGPTPYGKRLLQILNPYLRRVEKMAAATDEDGNLLDESTFVKPLNIIAITDGVFTDDAESVLASVAKRLDGPQCRAVPWQVGIQFFQIGDDEGARRYLEDLDDNLGKMVEEDHLRDIVDTVPWKGAQGQTLSAEGILKCTMGAINKKYDKRKAF